MNTYTKTSALLISLFFFMVVAPICYSQEEKTPQQIRLEKLEKLQETRAVRWVSKGLSREKVAEKAAKAGARRITKYTETMYWKGSNLLHLTTLILPSHS